MSINKGMMSSETSEWATPLELFNALDAEFNFTLDPCATAENTKCSKYFDAKIDGLKQSWGGHRVFMNPPYGREIGKWMEKAYTESQKENTLVVCLVPARTDTKWWHDYGMKVWPRGIRLIKGRIKFSGKGAAPFPSAIIIFKTKRVR